MFNIKGMAVTPNRTGQDRACMPISHFCHATCCTNWLSHLPVSSAGRHFQPVGAEALHRLGQRQGSGHELGGPSPHSSPDSQPPTAQSGNITTHRKLSIQRELNNQGKRLNQTFIFKKTV